MPGNISHFTFQTQKSRLCGVLPNPSMTTDFLISDNTTLCLHLFAVNIELSFLFFVRQLYKVASHSIYLHINYFYNAIVF